MKLFLWFKHRIKHKLSHLSLSYFKDILKKHGLALLIIIIAWEIIEDILFPVVFIFLGKTVHPVFLVGAPASWILCFHWLAVPLMWSAWIRLTGQKKSNEIEESNEEK